MIENNLSPEMSEQINICVDRLKEGVDNMDPDKLEMTRQKYGFADMMINRAFKGLRGLASFIAGQAAIAKSSHMFSDQVDGEIRFNVIKMVKDQNLSVQDMKEINEHVIDYMM